MTLWEGLQCCILCSCEAVLLPEGIRLLCMAGLPREWSYNRLLLLLLLLLP